MTWTALVLTLSALALPLKAAALAQQPEARPVIVALPDAFPKTTFPGAPQSDARAMIVREPGKKDMIVLNPEHVSADALGAALATLRKHRTMLPAPQRGVAIRITEFAPQNPQRSNAALTAKLQELRAQPHTQVGKMGRGQWIELADASLNP